MNSLGIVGESRLYELTVTGSQVETAAEIFAQCGLAIQKYGCVIQIKYLHAAQCHNAVLSAIPTVVVTEPEGCTKLTIEKAS